MATEEGRTAFGALRSDGPTPRDRQEAWEQAQQRERDAEYAERQAYEATPEYQAAREANERKIREGQRSWLDKTLDTAQEIGGVLFPVAGLATNPFIDLAQGQSPTHTYTGVTAGETPPWAGVYDPSQVPGLGAGPQGDALRARQDELAQLRGLLAGQVQDAGPRGVPTMRAASIDRGRLDRALTGDDVGRLGQVTAAQQMERAAAGDVPSAAAIGQQRALGQTTRGLLAAQAGAGSSAGYRAGLLAAQGGADAAGGALREMGAARGQEQALARAGYGDSLAAIRSAEQARAALEGNVAAADAGYEAQARVTNADQVVRSRRIDDIRRAALGEDALGAAGSVSASEMDALRRGFARDKTQIRRDQVVEALRTGADLQQRLAVLNAISGAGAVGSGILADRMDREDV